MRLVVLAFLMVAVSGDRPKRTLGVIFRGLVDANMRRTTPPPKVPGKVEKLKGPPPATVYLIPVPERDKKSQVQVFKTPPPVMNSNATKTRTSLSENFVTSPPVAMERQNKSLQEPKQFLIRITNEDGKSIMLKVTGDDLQVKKRGDGYMIGVSHKEAKANINIDLQDKMAVNRSGLVQSNLVEKYNSFFSEFSTSPDRYVQPIKIAAYSGKQQPNQSPQFPAYPYPVFLPSPFLQRNCERHLDEGTKDQTTTERPLKPCLRTTKQPSVEERTTNTTSEVPNLQLTVRVKGGPVMKETVAETTTRATTEPLKQTTQSMGYQYPVPQQMFQEPLRYQGSPSNQGSPGYQEPPSYQGSPSNQGAPGYQGSPSNQGSSGYQGSPSNQGSPGYHESSRYPGLSGYQGLPSYQDSPGFQGWPSYQGSPNNDPSRYQGSYDYKGYEGSPGYVEAPTYHAPSQYQWYMPPHEEQVSRPIEQHRVPPQEGNWNFAHYTPYPSYPQDSLAPPFFPSGNGRPARSSNAAVTPSRSISH